MAITAADVNKLRTITGAGMMDCKKALEESGGDFDAAIDLLRKKGQKVSEKRSDREAKEGAVFAEVFDGGKAGVMFELNCETDFVARNDDFQGLGKLLLEAAKAHRPATADALLALTIDGRPLSTHLTDGMGRIGEKLEVSKYELMAAQQVVAYIHPGARIGVLVAFGETDGKDVAELGRDVAMQVAAMDPIALDKDGVEKSVIDREIEIGKEQARAEGKPENIIEKIALGKLDKFYKERTLLHQEFVKDSSKSVSQHIAALSPKIKLVAFRRMGLGS
ncbi:MAG: translation elongation factor Ts [Bacteroidia bacterium]|nr:translation elongation factor Ts [Bacteroidia bacterium]